MNRVLLIARRDYLQTILSKGYLIGLVLLPLIFGGGFVAVSYVMKSNVKERRIVVLDRTGVSAAAVIQACEESNRRGITSADLGSGAIPRFLFEQVKPETVPMDQLLSLSGRIRSGELFLVLDIPPDALQSADNSKRDPVRYYSNSAGFDRLGLWLPGAVNDGLRRVRLQKLGIDSARVSDTLQNVPLVSMNLLIQDAATGKTSQSERRNPIQASAVPFFLVFLLIMVVMVGAAPNLGAVAEDKMQRVFEMLLGSASSFELMMGKVLAALATSLTSSLFYIVGGLLVLAGMAMFGLAPLNMLPWFFVYLIADVAMLSALGVALGSAAGTPQDAQHLAFFLFVPVLIPVFMLTPVMAQPNGVFATTMSFIPPFTPVLMLLRQALPGGVPEWQPWVGLAGIIAWAGAMIWIAARIFRIGILSQGRVPKLRELAEWVVRG